ncbi:arsenite transporter ATPase-like protein [Alicycliphilus sp. B1]|nr:arsenite transporter ATPase-like protein [Alicycliphilus sp. B1]
MARDATTEEISTVREQLSGACTTEIASFDEFSSLLADKTQEYDHIVFGHGFQPDTRCDY